jgi:hypothetical protein
MTAVERALARLRQPGAFLVLSFTPDSKAGRHFSIAPGGPRVADETAKQLIEHPDVRPCDDGLFGIAQTLRYCGKPAG